MRKHVADTLYVEPKRLNINQLWEIVETFSPDQQRVMHALYDRQGNPTPETLKEIKEILSMSSAEFNTARTRAFRKLFHPTRRKLYIVPDPTEGVWMYA